MSFFRFRARPGMNLIEVLVAAVVAGIVLLGLGGFITRNASVSGSERDRSYAMQKAIQMLEEMSSIELKGPTDTGPDKYEAQGVRFELTTVDNVTPDSPLSGNPRVGPGYKYVRLIDTSTVPGDEYARKVTVQVYYAARLAVPGVDGKPLAVVSGLLRSNVANVGPKQAIDVYAISIENIPHVYRRDDNDQFLPSATAARLQFSQAIRKLEEANPWLKFNLHYITRLSVGRDKKYRPYVNGDQPLHGGSRDPLDWAYFYPGKLTDAADSPRYYDSDVIGGQLALGRTSASPTPKPGYALADQYNHAVRYAEEFNEAGLPIDTAGNVIADPEDMSLRQFLEVLLTAQPNSRYRNGILVNLHGELFPALPLRNYSDAAKDLADPDTNTDRTDVASAPLRRRIVTHPYKLNFDPTILTEKVKLLVHPYMADGNVTPTLPPYAKRARIVIKQAKTYMKDNPLAPSGSGTVGPEDATVKVVYRYREPGGVVKEVYGLAEAWPTNGLNPSVTPYGPDVGIAGGASSDPKFPTVAELGTPSYAGLTTNDLVIEVNKLEYDARWQDRNGTEVRGNMFTNGGDPKYLLHRLQYFPDPYLAFLDTAIATSTSPAGKHARNTARLVIEYQIDETKVSIYGKKQFEVITQLQRPDGTWANPSTEPNDPTISRTWFYTGEDAVAWDLTTKLYSHIPRTEQVQLLGDPRHNPYLDVRKRGLFNPYFAEWRDDDEVYFDVKNKAGDLATCYDTLNPFAVGAMAPPAEGVRWRVHFQNSAHSYNEVKYNVPAYFRLWRDALLRNNMVYVNLAGEPFRYIGLGGEFKLEKKVDDVGDLHVSKKPYNGNSGNDADGEADELFSNRANLIEQGDNNWGARPWIGELFPYHQGPKWNTSGNLASGASGSNEFKRRRPESIETWDKYATNNDDHKKLGRTIKSNIAFASFLNATQVSGGTPVAVSEDDKWSKQTDTGEKMALALQSVLEGANKARFAYKLTTGSTPPEWSIPPYDTHLGIDWLLPVGVNPPAYYEHDKGADWYANAPILLKDPSLAANRAIVVANTFRMEGSSSAPGLMEAGVASMLEAFLDGTQHALGEKNIKSLPRVKLKTPRSGEVLTGTTANLEWYAKWSKASGRTYSPFFEDTFEPPPAPSLGGPLEIVYFVKYREAAATNWQTAALTAPTVSTSVATTEGEPITDGSVPLITNEIYPAPITATWDTTAIPNGQYLLRVEGFRTTDNTQASATMAGHHTFHEIQVQISH